MKSDQINENEDLDETIPESESNIDELNELLGPRESNESEEGKMKVQVKSIELNLNEVITDMISKAIRLKIDSLTDEKIQELIFPIVQKEFNEKIAPAIESNIIERVGHHMLKVKDIVREVLSEIFNNK
jgi:hypothetical protein